MPYALKLTRDTFEAGGRAGLLALNRVLYVLAGSVVAATRGTESPIGADTGWHAPGPCVVTAGSGGASVLRYELTRNALGPAVLTGVTSTVLLEHPIDLDPAEQYLMRNDRVDFAPGGVALPHRHRGGGIRCLLEGSMELRIGDEPPRVIRPGQAWFESGREPVYAAGAADAPTSFIRVSILPRSIKGTTSIMYVDPAHAAQGKPRKYTVYVDEPIEIA